MIRRFIHAMLWGAPKTLSTVPIIRHCACGASAINGGSPGLPCPSLEHEQIWLDQACRPLTEQILASRHRDPYDRGAN